MIASPSGINFAFMKDQTEIDKGRALAKICNAREVKPATLARAMGTSPQTVNNWLKRGVSTEYALRVSNFLGCYPTEISNIQPIARAALVAEESPLYATNASKSVQHAAGEPHATYDTNTLEHAGAPRTARRVPIKGRAKLGDDGFYEDITEDGWVDSYSPDPEAYGIRVKGDSMHPAIRSGSVVIVEPNGACIPAEFVAIALKNGSKMVKELVAERTDEIIVESVNGNCRQTIEKADILQIHPVAAVVSPSKWRAE